MLKSLEEGAMTELIRICQDIYTTEVWPEDFLQSIIIPIKKKRNATWHVRITEPLAFSPMHQQFSDVNPCPKVLLKNIFQVPVLVLVLGSQVLVLVLVGQVLVLVLVG